MQITLKRKWSNAKYLLSLSASSFLCVLVPGEAKRNKSRDWYQIIGNWSLDTKHEVPNWSSRKLNGSHARSLISPGKQKKGLIRKKNLSSRRYYEISEGKYRCDGQNARRSGDKWKGVARCGHQKFMTWKGPRAASINPPEGSHPAKLCKKLLTRKQ